MKILLIGEYNSSHNTLKEGLETFGHKVTVLGFGDGFKKRKVDVNFTHKYKKGIGSLPKKGIYKIFKIDLTSLHVRKQFYAHKALFENNDIVQLINENTFGTLPKIEKELLAYIFKKNKHVFLLSCGTDYTSVHYALQEKFRYSIATPYLDKKGTKKTFLPMVQYVTEPFVKLHQFIYKNIKGVIASDIDYHLPLLGHPLYLGMVPNPINLGKLPYITPQFHGKIVIFHGINNYNYYKKGNDIFEAALKVIAEKFSNKIEIITVRSVPYEKYITLFDKAHILLDQVYAYDQGFNALEAMAKGKVVFTGAEKEWREYYNIQEDTVAINALPDAKKIAEKLEMLIKNPKRIIEISKNARQFVEQEHHYVNSAKKYLEKWKSAI